MIIPNSSDVPFKSMNRSLPSCSGYRDYWGEFDCDAVHGESCEDCLCNFHTLGGLYHPETGRKMSHTVALRLYGPPEPEQTKDESIFSMNPSEQDVQ